MFSQTCCEIRTESHGSFLKDRQIARFWQYWYASKTPIDDFLVLFYKCQNQRGIMSNKNTNKVDKIRDLIFGNQIKDFESQFENIHEKLNALEENLTQAMHEAHDKLKHKTEHSLKVLEEKLDNLSESTQKDRSKFKELIRDTEKNLQNELTAQDDAFLTKLKVLKENIEHNNEKLSSEMTLMQHELQSAIEKKISRLSDDKLSRDTMAQMLVDVAMQIHDKEKSTPMNKGKKSGK